MSSPHPPEDAETRGVYPAEEGLAAYTDETIKTGDYQAATFSELQATRNRLVVMARLLPCVGARAPLLLRDASIALADPARGVVLNECQVDKVLPPEAVTDDLIRSLDYLLQGSLCGESNTVLLYGPAHSGKTHTLMGSHGDGLLPQVVERFFAQGGDAAQSLELRALMVDDRDSVFDVSHPQAATLIKWHRTDEPDLSLITSVPIADAASAKQVLARVQKNASAKKNRSVIYHLYFSRQSPVVGFHGQLTLVDLIHSSYFKVKPSFDKPRSALNQLFASLRAGTPPDFTASSLVAHLRESFSSGHGRVALVAHVDSSASKASEALKAIRFLARLSPPLTLGALPTCACSLDCASLDEANLTALGQELRGQVAFLQEELRNCFEQSQPALSAQWTSEYEMVHRVEVWKDLEAEYAGEQEAECARQVSLQAKHVENEAEVVRMKQSIEDFPRVHEALEMEREEERQSLRQHEERNHALIEESRRFGLSKERLLEIVDQLEANLKAARAELEVLEKAAKNPAFKKRTRKAAAKRPTIGVARPGATVGRGVGGRGGVVPTRRI